MLKKKYYDGFTVHDILNKHLDDGHKILELLTAFADADGVDAEPVTRCAECVWYVTRQMKYDGTLDKRYKPTWCELWRAEMKGNDYCSRGERK